MYMFDKHILSNDLSEVAEKLNVPKYFEDDLFSLLESYDDDHDDKDKEGKVIGGDPDKIMNPLTTNHDKVKSSVPTQCRPDWRWLIAGPKRSGSSFHVDPNGTSAFNACLSGSKKWVLFPPSCCPPGVIPSSDGSEVKTPVL
jgi:hypothetical protein